MGTTKSQLAACIPFITVSEKTHPIRSRERKKRDLLYSCLDSLSGGWMLPYSERLTLQQFHTLLSELLWDLAYMERARKTGDPNQDLKNFWNLLKLLKSLLKGSFCYFSESKLVGDEMPLSCCHKTKVCLGEMYSRDSKVLSIRFISPFCCTALGLMWAVSSMGSAPAHISLTIKNTCSLTTASQGKGWSNSTADST